MGTIYDLASLTLFPATPAQVIESRKRTWPQWGGALTKEQYLERDAQKDLMEHATESKMITWVLAPRDKPDTLDFMCSCETYKRQGLIRYPGSKELQEATGYGVASVFTPPVKQGKGYASHMMRLLHWVTSGRTAEYNLPEFPAEWGAPPPEVKAAGNGMFSVLYSDVGENFYKRAGPGLEKAGGWEAREPISTIWEIPQHAKTQQKDSETEWTWLKYGDLDALWAKDVQPIRRTMENVRESSPTYYTERPTAFVSYIPDKGVGSFHIPRSMFAAENEASVDIWAVEKNNGSTDQPTYASWSVDARPLPPTLIVTRISANETDFPELLGKIQELARKSGIGRMEVWNIHKHLLKVAAETGGQTFERKEHLPAIKWYGKGTTADIEWAFNEKFCWC
ncbi:hypothetical protein PAXINDRAFT_173616 [Paxillus involutus ATCC 200175]|nr:hypothetical protein PAXINDRAFT_173616 [Paxillus involutus ATCC 200175]